METTETMETLKQLYHSLRPSLEALPEASPEAVAQYTAHLGGTELTLAALRGEEDMVKVGRWLCGQWWVIMVDDGC